MRFPEKASVIISLVELWKVLMYLAIGTLDDVYTLEMKHYYESLTPGLILEPLFLFPFFLSLSALESFALLMSLSKSKSTWKLLFVLIPIPSLIAFFSAISWLARPTFAILMLALPISILEMIALVDRRIKDEFGVDSG